MEIKITESLLKSRALENKNIFISPILAKSSLESYRRLPIDANVMAMSRTSWFGQVETVRHGPGPWIPDLDNLEIYGDFIGYSL